MVEKIGSRFPNYHPGVYNGIFSFAIVGGLLAPCTLGYFAGEYGVKAVMALPLAGSLIVFVLLVLTWLEARLYSSAVRPDAAAFPMCDARGMRFAQAFFAMLCLARLSLAADLNERLTTLFESKPSSFGAAGIHVVDAGTGATLFAANEDRLFLPASNLKLFTSALALEKLGPGYRFTTRVLSTNSGDLILVGSGDPSLSGRVYPYKKDARPGAPLDPIEDLAAQIAKRGIRRVDGDIVGDDTLYPWAPYPANWSTDDIEREYGAPVSALSLDDNTVAITIQPGARVGEHASMSVSPTVEFLTIDHRVITSPRGASSATQPVIHLRQVPGSRQWIVTGSIPAGHAAVNEFLPVDDPAVFAATALYDALVRRGVAIHGRAVARHRAFGVDLLPIAGEEIAARQSPPLGELLRMLDKISQNLHAEMILREVGRVKRLEATTDAGAAELSAFVRMLEASFEPTEPRGLESRLDDGSGLGRNSLVAPRVITKLLEREFAANNRELWISLLPVGGEDGTLEHRMCCVSDGAAIHAKTGTLGRAIALSGYANSKSSGWLAFSNLVNDFSAPSGEVRPWIDKIALALTE